MNHKFAFEDFELEVSKNDERLLILAENRLTDFFQRKTEKANLSLTNEGVLKYSCQVLFGSLAKEMVFIIDLEKKKLDPLTRLEKLVNIHSVRLSELEKTSQLKNNDDVKRELDKFIELNDKRYHTLEKLMLEKFDKLEQILIKTDERLLALEADKNQQQINNQAQDTSIGWTFNASELFAEKYSLTNNNKTAIAKTAFPFSILAKEPIPKDKNIEFSFLIDNNNHVIVGIVANTVLNYAGLYMDTTCFGLSHNGYLICEGKSKQISTVYGKGDKVSFVVNMITGQVLISVNSKSSDICNIPRNLIESCTFYPYLFTNAQAGAGVTFI